MDEKDLREISTKQFESFKLGTEEKSFLLRKSFQTLIIKLVSFHDVQTLWQLSKKFSKISTNLYLFRQLAYWTLFLITHKFNISHTFVLKLKRKDTILLSFDFNFYHEWLFDFNCKTIGWSSDEKLLKLVWFFSTKASSNHGRVWKVLSDLEIKITLSAVFHLSG